jgi:soluble P-type ATPase
LKGGKGDLRRDPWWGQYRVLDLKGIIATDGRVPVEVRERINLLSEKANIYVMTADT